MRKLGHGQSVLILSPPDIDIAIRKATHLANDEQVGVHHVLQWAMLETCEDIARHIPHWAEQGVDYDRRKQAQSVYDDGQGLNALERGWLRPEAQTLDEVRVLSPCTLPLSQTLYCRCTEKQRSPRTDKHSGIACRRSWI